MQRHIAISQVLYRQENQGGFTYWNVIILKRNAYRNRIGLAGGWNILGIKGNAVSAHQQDNRR
jgi:hypothetical protein